MMPDSIIHYDLPAWPLLRWCTAVRPGVSIEIQQRLIGNLFNSIVPLVLGAIAYSTVTLVAVIRHPSSIFIALLSAEIILLGARIILLRRARSLAKRNCRTPTDIFLASSLVWAALIGIGTAACVATRDPVLQMLAPTCIMGLLVGLVVRNNGAPRLAIAQVVLCDLPFKLMIPFCGEPWLLVSCAQFPMFLIAMVVAVSRLNEGYLAVVQAERESERRATHDALTGLYNRSGLMAAISRNLGRQSGVSGSFALLYLDLDGFKAVNDDLGHAAGDEVLRQVARRIDQLIPEDAILARLGGDEFIFLVPDCDLTAAHDLGTAVVAILSQSFDLGLDRPAVIGGSIGIAHASAGKSTEALLAEADAALYRAKAGGRGRCVLAQSSLDLRGSLASVRDAA